MAKPRWFRFFGMDFLGSRKVVAMNTPQRGAYMQLLILEWDDPDCSVPKDLNTLKAMAGWSNAPESWGSFEPVRACFTTHPKFGKRLYNARLYEEWLYCQERSESATESAKARWQKPTPLNNSKPVMVPKDRISKGLTPIAQEVAAITDKWLPPQ